MLLVDALPQLATELQELLAEAGKAELASQIPSLENCRSLQMRRLFLRVVLYAAQAEWQLWSRP